MSAAANEAIDTTPPALNESKPLPELPSPQDRWQREPIRADDTGPLELDFFAKQHLDALIAQALTNVALKEALWKVRNPCY